MRGQSVVALLGATVVALAGCSGPGPIPPTPSNNVASIAITADSMIADSLPLIAGGDTARVKATALDASGKPVPGVAFTWTSSNTGVATVSDSGLITAVDLGEADITVTVADQASGMRAGRGGVDFAIRDARAASKFHVVPHPHLVITPASATIDIAQTASYHVSATDYNGTPRWGYVSGTWSSSASNIASISPPAKGSSASALGVSYGTTQITAVVFIGSGRYEKSATLNVAACSGALQVPSWRVDTVSYSYFPLGVTAQSATYSVQESGGASATPSPAFIAHGNADSSQWYGPEQGTASDDISLTVTTAVGTDVTTESTNGATPLVNSGIKLTIWPTTTGACWYRIEYNSQYKYTETAPNGAMTTHTGGVVFQAVDTLPQPTAQGQWTLSASSLQVPALSIIGFGPPPTGNYYYPGTDLADGAAGLAVTSAYLTWHIHANTK